MSFDVFGDFGFVGGTDQPADPYQNSQLCLNYYPEANKQNPKEILALLGRPGLDPLCNAPGGGAPGFSNTQTVWPQASSITNLPVRGCWVLPGQQTAIVVISNAAYLATAQLVIGQFPNITLAPIGNLATSSGPVSIRDNGAGGVACIVDGPAGYYYVFSSGSNVGPIGTFTAITDPGFLGADKVAFIDGWWIFNQPGTQVFYTPSSTYSTSFSGSNFALADAQTDKLVTLMDSKEELWLMCETHTEIWYDGGGAYFPFIRLVGTPLQVGCKAKHSIARFNSEGQDGLIWFGRSDRGENVIIRTKGLNADTVSTPAFGNAVAQYPVTSDAIGYTYQEDTHEFYVLTFPTQDVTWVYDAQTGLLHNRASYDPYTQTLHRERPNCIMNFANMRIVGDYQNGTLYSLTRNAQTDAGWPILGRRRGPHVWDKGPRGRVFHSSLQIDFARAVGNSSGMGSNPMANLRISRDGGTNFGAPLPAPLCRIGETKNRTMWRRLGMARDTVFEIEVIDPVARDIVGVTLKSAGETLGLE